MEDSSLLRQLRRFDNIKILNRKNSELELVSSDYAEPSRYVPGEAHFFESTKVDNDCNNTNSTNFRYIGRQSEQVFASTHCTNSIISESDPIPQDSWIIGKRYNGLVPDSQNILTSNGNKMPDALAYSALKSIGLTIVSPLQLRDRKHIHTVCDVNLQVSEDQLECCDHCNLVNHVEKHNYVDDIWEYIRKNQSGILNIILNIALANKQMLRCNISIKHPENVLLKIEKSLASLHLRTRLLEDILSTANIKLKSECINEFSIHANNCIPYNPALEFASEPHNNAILENNSVCSELSRILDDIRQCNAEVSLEYMRPKVVRCGVLIHAETVECFTKLFENVTAKYDQTVQGLTLMRVRDWAAFVSIF